MDNDGSCPTWFFSFRFLKDKLLDTNPQGCSPSFRKREVGMFFQHNSTKQWVCGRYGDGSIPIDTFLVG
jgi:hypothetical protein